MSGRLGELGEDVLRRGRHDGDELRLPQAAVGLRALLVAAGTRVEHRRLRRFQRQLGDVQAQAQDVEEGRAGRVLVAPCEGDHPSPQCIRSLLHRLRSER
jgi:hypothetical protein